MVNLISMLSIVAQYWRVIAGVVFYKPDQQRMRADNAVEKIQRQTIEIESNMTYYCSRQIIKI